MSLFRTREKWKWIPTINPIPQYAEIESGTHILIAGATGSGKSVLINGLLCDMLAHTAPVHLRLCLIDPKKTELYPYRQLPHCDFYADTTPAAIKILDNVIYTMSNREKKTRKAGTKTYTGSKIIVVIDELADLMVTDKKSIMPRLQKITQLGRASNIHLIAATQCPNRIIIPAALTVNFTDRIALRCQTAIESRQIIGVNGAENLPICGNALYLSPRKKCPQLLNIPMISDETIHAVNRQWQTATVKKKIVW